MKYRKFIEDQELVRRTLSILEFHSAENAEHEALYHDPRKGQLWEKYRFEMDGEMDDGIGLRVYPYPDLDEIIELALTSEFHDEIEGAAALIYELESQRIDVRKPLLLALEAQIEHILPYRFELIYWRTQIYDSTNKRNVLGKELSEIKKDHAYYQETAAKANKLRAKILHKGASE